MWQDSLIARAHGVNRIAFELHPLHLVYNVPTLLRLRDAVGPAIGANLDPSHMFWQQMDPVRVIRALGSALSSRPPQGHGAVGRTGRAQRCSRSSFVGGPHNRSWVFGLSERAIPQRSGPPSSRPWRTSVTTTS